MIAGVSALVLGIAAAPLAGPSILHDATIDIREVQLGMLADLSRAPASLRARAETLSLARIPRFRNALVLSSQRIHELAKARLPLLALWWTSERAAPITIRLARPEPGAGENPRHATACLQAGRDLGAGVAPIASDFTAADCAGAAEDRPIRYDQATRAVRTLRVIKAGEVLPAIPTPVLARVRPGEHLYVSTGFGPVRVEREVQALQPAVGDRALFVRSSDGSIFEAPSPGELP